MRQLFPMCRPWRSDAFFLQGLRRLRSWSQDALKSQDALNRASMDNPATGSSVDSTKQATLNDSELGAGGGSSSGGGGGADGPQQQQQQRQFAKSYSKKLPSANESTRKSIVSEPDLDDGEVRPMVYGFLHKLGRNGHWQCRFFESDGERLTYYKNVKRTNVLATLDLCKVSLRPGWSFFSSLLHSFFELKRTLTSL